MTNNRFSYAAAICAAAILGGCSLLHPDAARPEKAPTIRSSSTGDVKLTTRIDSSSTPAAVSAGICQNMEGSACLVRIKVSDRCSSNPALVVADPEYTVARRQAPVTLLFRIETEGWVFAPSKGIYFKNNPNGELVDGGLQQPNQWAWYSPARTNHTVFTYEINVVNTRTKEACRRDPGYVTDWP